VLTADKVTSGAASDLEMATRTARAMVLRYGMSEIVGFSSTGNNNDHQSLSPEQKYRIDLEVKTILDSSYQRAKELLSKNESVLHRLAKELQAKESLSASEIAQIVGVRLQKKQPLKP
jgi:cell division protease FtsH